MSRILVVVLLALRPIRPCQAQEREPAGAAVTTIGAVFAMTSAELESARPVRLRGTVTCRFDNPDRDEFAILIQDGPQGIWALTSRSAVDAWPEAQRGMVARVTVGSEVEVRGTTDRGAYAPRIHIDELTWIADRGPPAPIDPDMTRLFRGEDNGVRAAVSGIVRGVRKDAGEVDITMTVDARRFLVRVLDEKFPFTSEALVDGMVRFVGVTGSVRNTRGEFIAPVLTVPDAAEITIIEKPAAGPFETRFVPLGSLGGFGAASLSGRRFNTRGCVTRVVPGSYLYLQEGAIGVRVEVDGDAECAPGDVLEVAGFLDMSRQIGCVTEAVVRRVGHEDPLQPTPIRPADIVAINTDSTKGARVARPGDYGGCLVTFPARLLESRQTRDGGLFLLASGDATVSASLTPATFEQLRHVEPGSELSVVGITTFEFAKPYEDQIDWLLPPIERLGLLIHAVDDVRVVSAPAWWTARRLALALGGSLAVFAGALVWVWLLRRQVARQLDFIEEKLQAEAVAEERRRIAREFHDTLQQGMAGLALRMQSAAAHATDADARETLRQHRQLLSRLQSECRDFLWDLRDPAHVEGTLEEAIRSQLLFLQSTTAVPLSMETSGTVPVVPTIVQYHLVRIVREAIHNAITHADATRIAVSLEATSANGAGGILKVEVVDDGVGFDVAARSEAHGHFGIRGTRERARWIGAELRLESISGRGTSFVVLLPLEAPDHDGSVNGKSRALRA